MINPGGVTIGEPLSRFSNVLNGVARSQGGDKRAVEAWCRGETLVATLNHAAPNAERILVFAPLGRDTEVLTRFLEEHGLVSVACHDAEQVTSGLSEGAAVVLLTEELLTPEATAMLTARGLAMAVDHGVVGPAPLASGPSFRPTRRCRMGQPLDCGESHGA